MVQFGGCSAAAYLSIQKNQFLFEELVKRDFKKKYKRTVLGMGWSILSPLLTLLVLQIVFGFYFGQSIPHYTIYLFCGNLIFAYYRESTTGGMNSLMSNASIFSKINVPKYLFLFSKNVSSLINFGLTMLIFFAFVFLMAFHLRGSLSFFCIRWRVWSFLIWAWDSFCQHFLCFSEISVISTTCLPCC